MAIKVYTLRNTLVPSSVEEYQEYKNYLKTSKQAIKSAEDSDSLAAEYKRKKERRTVFLADSASAGQALALAGISYEGEINLEDIEFCKVETQQKCLCGNLHIPKLNDVLGDKIQIYFFANRKNIVFVDDTRFAEKIMGRIMSNRNKPAQSRERFLYSFCAKFMDNDLDNLGRYERHVMQMEQEISVDDLDDITTTVAQLRRELLVLREYYDEMRDFGKQLEENENHFFSGKNLEYFGIISDRADRLMGRTMYLLDYVNQVRETYQGIVAEQQSENMKFLTVISTIFFPLTLITGWYGMNFENMPELAQGYPFVIGLSLLVVGTIIFICKKRKIF